MKFPSLHTFRDGGVGGGQRNADKLQIPEKLRNLRFWQQFAVHLIPPVCDAVSFDKHVQMKLFA